MQFCEPKRSWFIDQTICSNGKLYLTTLVDPLFLILPYLYNQCQSRAMILDQFVADETYPNTGRLIKSVSYQQIELIGDKKIIGDLVAFKYNEDKTMKWLKAKCLKTIDVLKQKNIFVGQGAISSTYVKSEKLDESVDTGEYVRYAHGIISDYLSDEFSEKLEQFLDIPAEIKKRKLDTEIDPKNVKKVKLNDSIEDVKENIKSSYESSLVFEESKTKIGEKKSSAKDKALAKAASGSKSISSFFKSKSS